MADGKESGADIEALRRQVAALEAELAAHRKAQEAVDGPFQAWKALLAEAEKLAHMGSWFFNVETQETKWTDEMFRILGYDPETDVASPERFFEALHPADRPRILALYQANMEKGADVKHVPYTTRVLRKDGAEREIQGEGRVVLGPDGKPLRLVGSIIDITERRQLEAQLRQSHKMEAVGRLAAGVAHDFNNLLSVISGNADLLLEARPDERLRRIRDAAEVGAALTRQLLSFSRQSVVRPAVLDLDEVVRDTARIIERLIGEHIAVRLHLGGDDCAVLTDRAQLQQILLNLAINARDAMPGGGEIRVTTSALPASGEGAPAGGWVRLAVEDTGSGMDEATRKRAFEPFFTTKEAGKGTGLGLSSVLDAVNQAGGRIAIESAPGQGTSVSILLPRRAPAAPSAPRPTAEAKGGSESILVVEDHPALRELIRCFLADAGYRVQVVGRPGEAEALWERTERDGGAIDLLVTDLVMPEKSGRALAAGLLARKASLKTLFISGYAQGMGPEKKVEGPYLQKPFTRQELLFMVRAIFDGAVSAGAAALGNGHGTGNGRVTQAGSPSPRPALQPFPPPPTFPAPSPRRG